jgi:hypothetical protein
MEYDHLSCSNKLRTFSPAAVERLRGLLSAEAEQRTKAIELISLAVFQLISSTPDQRLFALSPLR